MTDLSTLELMQEGFFLLTVMIISFGIYFKESL